MPNGKLPRSAPKTTRHSIEQAAVPAGSFLMGDSAGDGNAADGEAFLHEVQVRSFAIDATTVTNRDFATFVEESGYETESELAGYSAVFHLAFTGPADAVIGRPPQTPWWYGVKGAGWRHPHGPGSSLDGLWDHPVVHVSWNDAQAYCEHVGRRLPTEAEWEFAARGGLERARFPWGNELMSEAGSWQCNIWQGRFPDQNTTEDGWLTSAPVRSFAPNGYGLWQAVGNVWEWCSDWFDANYYRRSPHNDPQGPAGGAVRVMRGGSFLCHDSYCNRYRNSARSANTPESASSNLGFRTVSR
ncbi:formylglycine-generating enzyme family protein [Arthrobacter sp. UYCu712]|uniref:formylglycine-generating enzyme family protein n=1 Tax=Arthrobacter sp. UYCu712 TaxID=3156340 RepID=UPI0033970065